MPPEMQPIQLSLSLRALCERVLDDDDPTLTEVALARAILDHASATESPAPDPWTATKTTAIGPSVPLAAEVVLTGAADIGGTEGAAPGGILRIRGRTIAQSFVTATGAESKSTFPLTVALHFTDHGRMIFTLDRPIRCSEADGDFEWP